MYVEQLSQLFRKFIGDLFLIVHLLAGARTKDSCADCSAMKSGKQLGQLFYSEVAGKQLGQLFYIQAAEQSGQRFGIEFVR